MHKLFIYLKNFDWIIFFSVFLLVAFGLAEIYSIALGQDVVNLLNLKKQAIFFVIGIFLLFGFAFFDYHYLKSYAIYLYIGGLIVLVAVLFMGDTIRGTRGWFKIGGFSIQPVEFIKIILLISLAKFFSLIRANSASLKNFVQSGLVALFLVALVLLQPDFGSAVLLLFIWFSLVIIAGVNKKYIVAMILSFILVFVISWLFLFKDYQKQRVMTFINPSANSLDQGYNVTQAMIAVGAGGLNGKGIGFGSQSQLKFLPEAQNDFIFAVIAEELGFFGVILVITFFLVFFIRCLQAIKKINNDFGIYFILGSMGLIFIEMFINIGMNIGIMPVVGISLPFISYGGSSILSSLIIVGIIESIVIRSKINY